MFWQQWWSLDPKDPRTSNHVRDRAIAAFKNTSEGLVEYQRALADTLQSALDRAARLETNPEEGLREVFDSTRRTKSESTRSVGRRRQVFWNMCHLTSIFRRPENIKEVSRIRAGEVRSS
jgi:siroheme synthase (precorrin-2 oxidase/ferrochelatase)